MTLPLVHLAGEPEGLVQTCSLCGEVLLSYHHAENVTGWYAGSVASPDGGCEYVTTDPPNCTVRVG